jgi:hypothetical protein
MFITCPCDRRKERASERERESERKRESERERERERGSERRGKGGVERERESEPGVMKPPGCLLDAFSNKT